MNENKLCTCVVDITDQRLLSFRGNLNGCLGAIRIDYGDGRYLVQFSVPDEVKYLTISVATEEIVIHDTTLGNWKGDLPSKYDPVGGDLVIQIARFLNQFPIEEQDERFKEFIKDARIKIDKESWE